MIFVYTVENFASRHSKLLSDLLNNDRVNQKKNGKNPFFNKYALFVNYFGQGPVCVINDISLKIAAWAGAQGCTGHFLL